MIAVIVFTKNLYLGLTNLNKGFITAIPVFQDGGEDRNQRPSKASISLLESARSLFLLN